MLVVTNSTQLHQQRRLFEHQMGELVTLVKEQTSCHQGIADSLAELKVLTLLTTSGFQECHIYNSFVVLSGEVLAWLSVWSEVQMICIWSS